MPRDNAAPVLEFVEHALNEIAALVGFTIEVARLLAIALRWDHGFDFDLRKRLADV
jgi:hypothetical protein